MALATSSDTAVLRLADRDDYCSSSRLGHRYRRLMKFGLFAINYGTCANQEAAVRVAQHAEAAGFDSVWTGEHLVLPDPAPTGFSIPPALPFIDTIVSLSFLAASTSTITLASGIIVLPLRNPVVLAKELASIDVVSGGRLVVGLGAGYVAAEFEAVGVALAERGGRMDDYIDAMRALWSLDQPHYEGRFVSFADLDVHPRPLQLPGPPLVIGGESPGALRRAITRGNGWYGFNIDPALAHQCVDALGKAASEYERPPELGELELTITPIGTLDRATIERYSELGIHRLVLLPEPEASRAQRHAPVPVDRILRNIDTVADSFINR
jgi:probable F420-dependent oxidoreductase